MGVLVKRALLFGVHSRAPDFGNYPFSVNCLEALYCFCTSAVKIGHPCKGLAVIFLSLLGSWGVVCGPEQRALDFGPYQSSSLLGW